MAPPLDEVAPVAILGSGAVGVFVGARLDAAGTAPLFFVRGGARESRQWQLVDARTEVTRTLRAEVAPAAGVHAEIRHLLVCVRGDQQAAAVETALRLAPSAAIGLAAPVSATEIAALRARHPDRTFYLLVPMFNAWSDGEARYRWLQPPLVKSLLSGERDARASAAARAMSARLAAGRMRVRVVSSATAATATFFNAGLPLLVAWQISGWSPRVVEGAPLRRLTARAMRESLAIAREATGPAAALVRLLPASLIALGLATMRLFVSRHLVAMWQHHGPKIAGQTRLMLETMLVRAEAAQLTAPSLTELRARLDALEGRGRECG
jgi:ketopantoate reductase